MITYIYCLIDDPATYYEKIQCDSHWIQYNSRLNILKTKFGVKGIILEEIVIQNVIFISVRVLSRCE